MPSKPCAGKYGHCPNLVPIGERYCKECKPKEEEKEKKRRQEYDKKRGNAAKRGYDARWQKIRTLKLKRDPLCQKCAEKHILRAATLVHHIDGNPKNNASENLASVCNRCHEEIHKKDRWGRND